MAPQKGQVPDSTPASRVQSRFSSRCVPTNPVLICCGLVQCWSSVYSCSLWDSIVLLFGHKYEIVSCTHSRKFPRELSDVGSRSELSTDLVATIQALFLYRHRRTRGRILSFRHSRMFANGGSLGGTLSDRSAVFVDKYHSFRRYCSPTNSQEASLSSELEVSLPL